jgi:hypothetical protein
MRCSQTPSAVQYGGGLSQSVRSNPGSSRPRIHKLSLALIPSELPVSGGEAACNTRQGPMACRGLVAGIAGTTEWRAWLLGSRYTAQRQHCYGIGRSGWQLLPSQGGKLPRLAVGCRLAQGQLGHGSHWRVGGPLHAWLWRPKISRGPARGLGHAVRFCEYHDGSQHGVAVTPVHRAVLRRCQSAPEPVLHNTADHAAYPATECAEDRRAQQCPLAKLSVKLGTKKGPEWPRMKGAPQQGM